MGSSPTVPTMTSKKEPDLSERAWTNPDSYREVFSTKDAKSIILKHQGRISALGCLYDIVTSSPQVGTVVITLKRTNP